MTVEQFPATARIVRILVDCGMVAREELEIVRGLIRGPAGGRVLPGEPQTPGCLRRP